MKHIEIKGIICPLLTPMYEDESINEKSCVIRSTD